MYKFRLRRCVWPDWYSVFDGNLGSECVHVHGELCKEIEKKCMQEMFCRRRLSKLWEIIEVMSFGIRYTFLSAPNSSRIMKHWIGAIGLAFANHHVRSRLPHNFQSIWIYYSLLKWRFSCSLKWSYRSPSIMLTIEFIMVSIIWACVKSCLTKTCLFGVRS